MTNTHENSDPQAVLTDEARNAIFDANNDLDVEIHRLQTLIRMIHREHCDLSDGEPLSRTTLDNLAVLADCVELHIDAAEKAGRALFDAARKASGIKVPS